MCVKPRRSEAPADPLDLPVQLNAGLRQDVGAHRLAQAFDVGGGGIAGIDQEIGVRFGNLCAADPETTATGCRCAYTSVFAPSSYRRFRETRQHTGCV